MSLAPVAIASAIAMTLGGTAPVTVAPTKRLQQPPTERAAQAGAAALAAVRTENAPASYSVVAGDTVSGIADRFGITTRSILALNGLDWSSLIFPGQKLVLRAAATAAAPAPAAPQAATKTHTVVAGDTVSGIAEAAGLRTQQVLDANGLSWSSVIFPGQKLQLTAAATAAAPAAPAAATAPAAPAVPAVTPAVQSAPLKVHTVVAGDTISDIAASVGQSIQAILDANKLDWSSYIVPGQKITIPSPPSPEAARSAVQAGRIAELSDSMRTNAATIVAVGRELGVSDQGIVVALAAAAQESGLENVDYGDRDSLGLFQQRPSTGWGSKAQVRDPLRAAKAFFGGPANPNAGRTRGLLDISGWEGMSVTQAAQAVQISAYPDAYAKWEASARHWLEILG